MGAENMDSEFETLKAEFKKVIQKCVDMKWITLNEHISLDGVASQFANKMSEVKKHRETNQLIGKLVWLRDFSNDDFKNIMKLFKDELKK